MEAYSSPPEALKELHFDRHGLAPIRFSEDPGYLWMYVNRNGRVIVRGVPSVENFADEFSNGLVRTIVGDKYGFANRQGRIVIKPAYDWAAPFKHGHAAVCNRCREVCAMPGRLVELQSMPGCDHRTWVDGEWFKIDKNGHITARLPG